MRCARVKLLRDIGAARSPFNAFRLIQGLETLPLRLRQQNEDAIKVAEFLSWRADVERVIFPGLQTGEFRRRARRRLRIERQRRPLRPDVDLLAPVRLAARMFVTRAVVAAEMR